MITIPQIKAFTNQQIAGYLTKRADELTLMNSGLPGARQKDIDKVKQYLLGLSEVFKDKHREILARETQKQIKRAMKDGTTEVQSPGVQDNPQE